MEQNIFIITPIAGLPIACDRGSLDFATAAFNSPELLTWADEDEKDHYEIKLGDVVVATIAKTRFLTMKPSTTPTQASVCDKDELVTNDEEMVVLKPTVIMRHQPAPSSPAPEAQPKGPLPGQPQPAKR